MMRAHYPPATPAAPAVLMSNSCRGSQTHLLRRAAAVLCVLLADTLMHRAFDGDFAALIAWYQRNREPAGARPPR